MFGCHGQHKYMRSHYPYCEHCTAVWMNGSGMGGREGGRDGESEGGGGREN